MNGWHAIRRRRPRRARVMRGLQTPRPRQAANHLSYRFVGRAVVPNSQPCLRHATFGFNGRTRAGSKRGNAGARWRWTVPRHLERNRARPVRTLNLMFSLALPRKRTRTRPMNSSKSPAPPRRSGIWSRLWEEPGTGKQRCVRPPICQPTAPPILGVSAQELWGRPRQQIPNQKSR